MKKNRQKYSYAVIGPADRHGDGEAVWGWDDTRAKAKATALEQLEDAGLCPRCTRTQTVRATSDAISVLDFEGGDVLDNGKLAINDRDILDEALEDYEREIRILRQFKYLVLVLTLSPELTPALERIESVLEFEGFVDKVTIEPGTETTCRVMDWFIEERAHDDEEQVSRIVLRWIDQHKAALVQPEDDDEESSS